MTRPRCTDGTVVSGPIAVKTAPASGPLGRSLHLPTAPLDAASQKNGD
jgi:hypothetical protein